MNTLDIQQETKFSFVHAWIYYVDSRAIDENLEWHLCVKEFYEASYFPGWFRLLWKKNEKKKYVWKLFASTLKNKNEV